MRSRIVVGLLGACAVGFASGVWAAQQQAGLHPQTLNNLAAAMKGEAFAFAKYRLFAEHARQTGNAKLADLFDQTSNTERFQHFAEEAALTNLVGSDAQNLQDAIKGESYEVDTMYPAFARQARAAGDTAAASRFEEIRQDERQHRDAFQAALNRLQPTGGSGQTP